MKINPKIMKKVAQKRAEKLDIIHCLNVNIYPLCPQCGEHLGMTFKSDNSVKYHCTQCTFATNYYERR